LAASKIAEKDPPSMLFSTAIKTIVMGRGFLVNPKAV
jgi:hypothetical protein